MARPSVHALAGPRPLLGLFAFVLSASLGCAGPGLDAGFNAPDSGARLHAVEHSAATNDQSAIPDLVAMLESDDPALRMLSIRTLERLTGETLGYDYAAPRPDRELAIIQWRKWLTQTGRPQSSLPADGDPWMVPPDSFSPSHASNHTHTPTLPPEHP